MDWLEFTASTVEEATALAAAQLGLAADALEVEVLEAPVAGLFGRVRGIARVRARAAGSGGAKAKPRKSAGSTSAAPAKSAGAAKRGAKQPVAAAPETPESSPKPLSTQSSGDRKGRPKASGSALAAVAAVATAENQGAAGTDRSRQRGGRSGGNRSSSSNRPTNGPSGPRPPRDHDEPVDVQAVVDSAAKFLNGLLDAAGLDGVVAHRIVDEQTVEMSMTGEGLGMLVGPKGATLLATQELLRSYVHHDTGGRSGRLMLDVAGYREKRRAALQTFTKQVAQSVIESGERRVLEPMTAVDRKVVHDTVTDIDGVSSISEGEDPHRYVVLLPA